MIPKTFLEKATQPDITVPGTEILKRIQQRFCSSDRSDWVDCVQHWDNDDEWVEWGDVK
jgi:hypothetical protein